MIKIVVDKFIGKWGCILLFFVYVGVFFECCVKFKLYYCVNFIFCNLNLGVIMELVDVVLVILIFIGIL